MDLNTLSTIEKVAKVWQIQLNLEYCNKRNNTRMSFKDIGAFCELLATNYNADFVGCGSGGMGLDLVNYKTHKAVEVKSCCTIQNAVCKECGTKFNNLFLGKCPKCGSSDFKVMTDSRFGIDAKEFLSQYSEGFFENFTMCYISLVTQNIHAKTITIRLEWFITDFNDKEIKDIQLEYFENQNSLGKKPHCNLLPLSYDFYKLCPKKVDDKTITINYADLNVNPLLQDCPFKKDLRVPIEIIPRKDRETFMELDSFDKRTNTADCKDFTMNMPYKEKSLGKERGDTRIKVYNALK
jgi:hypothetical protein